MSSPRQAEHPVHPQFLERWSPRAFTGEALDEATLRGFLEAARWAPSAFNAQPWRVVWGLAGTPSFERIAATLVPFNQAWAAQASALLVFAHVTEWTPAGAGGPQALRSAAFDTGAAWASLALQVHLAGWAAHAMGGFDDAALRTALKAPAHVQLDAVVAIGRRGDPATLPEGLRGRESPSPRQPQAAWSGDGFLDAF